MNSVKYFGAVVSYPTSIADADRYSFKYDESLFVLESFAIDLLWANGSLAVFARVSVRFLLSGIC